MALLPLVETMLAAGDLDLDDLNDSTGLSEILRGKLERLDWAGEEVPLIWVTLVWWCGLRWWCSVLRGVLVGRWCSSLCLESATVNKRTSKKTLVS